MYNVHKKVDPNKGWNSRSNPQNEWKIVAVCERLFLYFLFPHGGGKWCFAKTQIANGASQKIANFQTSFFGDFNRSRLKIPNLNRMEICKLTTLRSPKLRTTLFRHLNYSFVTQFQSQGTKIIHTEKSNVPHLYWHSRSLSNANSTPNSAERTEHHG